METDIEILGQKCLQAIESYSVDMVVGNELHTRRNRVYIYLSGGGKEPKILEKSGSKDLEEDVVELIKSLLK